GLADQPALEEVLEGGLAADRLDVDAQGAGVLERRAAAELEGAGVGIDGNLADPVADGLLLLQVVGVKDGELHPEGELRVLLLALQNGGVEVGLAPDLTG